MANHLDTLKSWAKRYDLDNNVLATLVENGFDNLTSVALLNESDLDVLGFTKLGIKKKILAAVGEINHKIGKLRNMGGSLADINLASGYLNTLNSATFDNAPGSQQPASPPEANVSAPLVEPTGDAWLEYFEVRKAILSDVPQMLNIYNFYCKNFPELTSEEVGKTEQEFTQMYLDQDDRHCIIVESLIKPIPNQPVGTVLGYLQLKKFSNLSAHANVAEFAMYMNNDFKSKGIGLALTAVGSCFAIQKGFEKVIQRIVSTNVASIKLNEKLGLKKAGILEGICTIKGVPADLILYEKDILKDRAKDEAYIYAVLPSIRQNVVKVDK